MELTSQLIVQGAVNGLCMGGIYILVGLGLTLILSIMNIMQFAHGEIYMIGAFIVYFITVSLGIDLIYSIPISMVVTAAIGSLMERVFLRPLKGRFMSYVCVTTGLSLILQTVVVLVFGLSQKQIPNINPGVLSLAGILIPNDRLMATIISLALTFFLWVFLKRSKYGLAMVASAQNREGALIQGINPNLMSTMVVGIGSGLAAIGGAFAGSILVLDPYMGGMSFMKGITIIVIGGMGSVRGTVVGGLILGISESLVAIFLGQQISVVIPLLMVIIILIVRPKGLFGHD